MRLKTSLKCLLILALSGCQGHCDSDVSPPYKLRRPWQAWPRCECWQQYYELQRHEPYSYTMDFFFFAYYKSHLIMSNLSSPSYYQAVNFAISQMQTEKKSKQKTEQGKDHKARLAGDTVVLTVTADSLRVVETLSADVIMSLFIRDIMYTSVGYAKKKELFCFISNDDRLNRWSCHIFEMPPGAAQSCCEVLSGGGFMCLFSRSLDHFLAYNNILLFLYD